jgi:predicted membrane-bound spermidine synthase
MDLLLCLIFAASGAAALVFEGLWFRQASLVLGNSVWATGLTTSAFMAGLAVGNALCARYGHRVRHPLHAYALLEVTVAALGMAVVVGLPALSPALAGVSRPLVDHPAALNAVRLGVAFLVLSVPAAAMGATLPLLVETLGGTEARFGRALGRLYAFNTLGAVGGALAGEMFLVPRLGLRGTALVAVALDLLAALVALGLGRRFGTPAADEGAGLSFGRLWPRGARQVLVAAGLAGAVLLALEAVWFRFLLLFVCGTAVAFASMLAVVLAGISAGAFVAAAWLSRTPAAVRHAPALALAAGAAVVLGYVPFPLEGPADPSCGLRVVPLAAAVAFPVCALSGALFTLLGALVRPKVDSAVAATGAITLANTVGALLGGFAGAFLLLPLLGVEKSVFAGALAYAAVAALAARALGPKLARPTALAAAASLVALLVLFPFGLMQRRIVPRVLERFTATGSEVVATREGLTETSAWLTDRPWGQPVADRLITNSRSEERRVGKACDTVWRLRGRE